MGKFKVGQFVTANKGLYGIDAGEIVKVTAYARPTGLGDWILIEGRKNSSCDSSYLEGDFDVWTPKVGDRVRFTVDNRDCGKLYGERGEEVKIRRVYSRDRVEIEFHEGRKPALNIYPNAYIADLEPVADLKIELGKFYKSREGVKIGPMYKFNGDSWAVKGSGYLWIETGERYFKSDRGGPTDLISEWTEPKVNVAAQADTLSDEYGRGSVAPTPSNDNVAKPKFKVGDWVKWPDGGWLRYYEVTRIEGDSFWIDSFGIAMRYSLSSCDWLVRSVTSRGVDPTAIVALIEDGQPKPAARPYIHDTVESATTEANRLAAKHKGYEFGVYVLNGTFQVPKPTYDHQWQRLAADGKKIDAIKELRAITGLGLKPIKDAVEHWLATAA